jgi:hypothetical protein
MSELAPTNEKGSVVTLAEMPAEVDFACRHCGEPCKLYPRTNAVVHAHPGCGYWEKIKGDKVALGVFLINSGLPISAPPANR